MQCELGLIEDDLSMAFLIPVTPEVAESPGRLARSAGISLNGFQIAAQAPVEEILSSYTIAAFDDCGGHVNPHDGYHYHAASAEQNQHIACFHGKTTQIDEPPGRPLQPRESFDCNIKQAWVSVSDSVTRVLADRIEFEQLSRKSV